jgi:hypothetical protein
MKFLLFTLLVMSVSFAQTKPTGEGLTCDSQAYNNEIQRIFTACQALGGEMKTTSSPMEKNGEKVGYHISDVCYAKGKNYESLTIACKEYRLKTEDEIVREHEQRRRETTRDSSTSRGTTGGAGGRVTTRVTTTRRNNGDAEIYWDGQLVFVGSSHPCGQKCDKCARRMRATGKPQEDIPACRKCTRCLSDGGYEVEVVTNSTGSSDGGGRTSERDSSTSSSSDGGRRDRSDRTSRDRTSSRTKEFCYQRNGTVQCCEYYRSKEECLDSETILALQDLYWQRNSGSQYCAHCQQSKGAQIINALGNLGLGWGGMIGTIVSSNNMRRAAGYQWDAYTANSNNMLDAYKYGLDMCVGHQQGYWDMLVEQEYGLPEWSDPNCNGYTMGAFTGFNGQFQSPFGGTHNPYFSAGYSPGFMGGMIGPHGVGAGGWGGNPACMCFQAPCPCSSIGGGVSPFGGFNGGINFGVGGNPMMMGGMNPMMGGQFNGQWNGSAGGLYPYQNQMGNNFFGGAGMYNPYAAQMDYQNHMMSNQQALMGGGMGPWGGGVGMSPWNMGGGLNFNIGAGAGWGWQ